MGNDEINILISWAIKILEEKFESDPYSLSSDQLMALKLFQENRHTNNNKFQ